MSTDNASPQHGPEPFAALRRQIAYRDGLYNELGLEADLETAEALLAALKSLRVAIELGIVKVRQPSVENLDRLIAKAEGRER